MHQISSKKSACIWQAIDKKREDTLSRLLLFCDLPTGNIQVVTALQVVPLQVLAYKTFGLLF